MTVSWHQYESKFYSQLKTIKNCIPYRNIDAAAGANNSALRYADIILRMMHAVKGG